LYNKLCSGEYEIEYFNSIELMIPSCDDSNCQENRNLWSIELVDNEFVFSYGCLK